MIKVIYEILDKQGKVVNKIIADLEFVEKQYKGLYRDVTPEPVVTEKPVIKTLDEKVDELITKVDILTAKLK